MSGERLGTKLTTSVGIAVRGAIRTKQIADLAVLRQMLTDREQAVQAIDGVIGAITGNKFGEIYHNDSPIYAEFRRAVKERDTTEIEKHAPILSDETKGIVEGIVAALRT